MATLEKQLYDANRAREVLENEVFIQVWADVEQELTKAWQESPARDVEGREKIFLTLQMLRKLHKAIQSTLDSGKLAEKELQHKKTLADRARGIWPQ
ncbi:hypothetical protein [Pseudomonas multiresinivorans]|uniref:Protein FliT n=1 Tax=Pseudomonas multiresinivorans TaxID=95301 RepID=A0A7Z3BPX2_9PSED|nr:hypothetical protein [Pseudomonas multiresinivorans]QJP10462.1 hypothetical protein G4G71_22185 [Pseudomonas multiresinivorans]